MNDHTINATPGKPCKGKEAARVLAMIVLSPDTITDPTARMAAIDALRPFGWPNVQAMCERLEIHSGGFSVVRREF